VKSPEARNPEASYGISAQVTARGHKHEGVMKKELVPEARVLKMPVLVTEEDLHGLEASGLTQRSRGHRLKHSWVSGLILIPMKEVIEDKGGN
jgi:hypothetical protein